MAESSGTHWREAEILALIGIWGEEEIYRETEDTRRKKKPVYGVIRRRLSAIGINREEFQIKSKIRALKAEYKSVLKDNNTSGNARKTCSFFKELDRFLGRRPSLNLPSGSVLETAPDSCAAAPAPAPSRARPAPAPASVAQGT